MSKAFTWGVESAERSLSFPCDRLMPAGEELFRGVTVEVDAPTLFRWLCQLRVAPYSYDWIDNFGTPSPRELTPGADELQPGQRVMRVFEVAGFERGRHLTVRAAWPRSWRRVLGDGAATYLIRPLAPHRCRLLVKLRVVYPQGLWGSLMRLWFPLGDLIMMRRQLLNLKALAEST